MRSCPMRVLASNPPATRRAVAVYDDRAGPARARAVQPGRPAPAYGGVVPELASRDHVRRLLPLVREALASAGAPRPASSTASPTRPVPGWSARCWPGAALAPQPGLRAGACRRSASTTSRGTCWRRCSRPDAAAFPYLALLVSGGHTHAGRRRAAWATTACWARPATTRPARPSTRRAKLLGLPYPGGPPLARAREHGPRRRVQASRGRCSTARASTSASQGLKTASLACACAAARSTTQRPRRHRARVPGGDRRHAGGEGAAGARRRPGIDDLVVAGGVGANRALRERLQRAAAARGARVYFPRARVLHRQRRDDRAGRARCASRRGERAGLGLAARARWPLDELRAAGAAGRCATPVPTVSPRSRTMDARTPTASSCAASRSSASSASSTGSGACARPSCSTSRCPVDCARAAASDDVDDTVDYKQVAKRVLAFVERTEFQLVETLAHRLAHAAAARSSGSHGCGSRINKPGAIRHSRDVGVTHRAHARGPDRRRARPQA